MLPPASVAEPRQTSRSAECWVAGLNGLAVSRRGAPLPQVGRKPNEIFVSDGSKCDIGRLQLMFGADVTVALQVGRATHAARPRWCRRELDRDCRRQRCDRPPRQGGPTGRARVFVCGGWRAGLVGGWGAWIRMGSGEGGLIVPPTLGATMQDPAYPVYVDSSVIMGMTGACCSSTCSWHDLCRAQPVPHLVAHACMAGRTGGGNKGQQPACGVAAWQPESWAMPRDAWVGDAAPGPPSCRRPQRHRL